MKRKSDESTSSSLSPRSISPSKVGSMTVTVTVMLTVRLMLTVMLMLKDQKSSLQSHSPSKSSAFSFSSTKKATNDIIKNEILKNEIAKVSYFIGFEQPWQIWISNQKVKILIKTFKLNFKADLGGQ